MNKGLVVLIWFLAVATIFIATFGMVSPFLWHWVFPTQPVPEVATAVSDLLPIIVALLALGVAALGGGTYYILSQRIQDDAARIAEMRSQRAIAISFCNQGFSHWARYKHTRDVLQPPDRFFLDEAIALTSAAYEDHAKKLSESEPENEELICTIRNNWGYYLGEKQRISKTVTLGEERLAKKFADYIEARVIKYPSHAEEWGKTIQFIRSQFNGPQTEQRGTKDTQ